jgi:hypothetical protein
VDDALALRLCTINPRTTRADLDLVLAAILEAGRKLLASQQVEVDTGVNE